MKTCHLLLLASACLIRSVVAAPPPDLTLRVVPERDLVYSGGQREVIVQIELEARKPERGRRVPMNLSVVLDRSGSMSGAKIEKARQAAAVALDQLADDDIFSLVIYDNESEVLIPPQPLGGSRSREKLKAQIETIRPGGGTALHAGVSLGARQIRKFLDQEHINRIVLLSDGLANAGPSRPSDLASLGRELRGEGMAITTIGLGDDYNEDLMTALAEASNANYYYVQDAEKLPGIFSEELGVARSLVARGVIIRIVAPEGVRLQEIIGRPEIVCRERWAEIAVPELFGAEKRRFLARCVVEGKADAPLQVAAVDLNYQTAEGVPAPAQNQAAAVKFTAQAKDSDDSMRADVAREANVVGNRLAKERAVKLADEGKPQEAIAELKSQSSLNAAAPAASQLPASENLKLESTWKEIESGGSLSKAGRKSMQYDNWKDKYQKQ